MSFDAAHCTLCPRRCGADREKGVGLCHCGTEIRIARAALHFWEEPCISGKNGSGAVFFSGCALGCIFCQNRKISRKAVGKIVTVEQLSEIFLALQEQQAHNINLVTGSHYTPWIVQALELAKPKLHIPVVWNCGGYESMEILHMLDGLVDIYLPDLKFYEAGTAKAYAGCPDYFTVAAKAIAEIFSTEIRPKNIRVRDRATLFNLLIGLNGYTVCSGIIDEELNDKNIIAVPLDEEGEMHIGYITRRRSVPSRLGSIYLEALKQNVTKSRS